MSDFRLEELSHYSNETYPILPSLDYIRRWLDGLMSIIEGYLMTFSTVLITVGISFSMYDFLTGGTALNDPTVFRTWAIVQVVAIDAQFVCMWYRLKVAIRDRKVIQGFIYLVLGLTLAFVTFGASVIPPLQKSMGIGFNEAIIRAGFDPTYMIYARSFVAVLLVIVGAFQRTVIHFDKAGMIKNLPQYQPDFQQKEPGNLRQWIGDIIGWFSLRKIAKELKAEEQEANELVVQLEAKTGENILESESEMRQENDEEDGPTLQEIISSISAIIMPENEIETGDNMTQELPEIKSEKQQKRYAASEVVGWQMCKRKSVKVRDINKAIGEGRLKANLSGKFSKNALESWLRSLEKVAA